MLYCPTACGGDTRLDTRAEVIPYSRGYASNFMECGDRWRSTVLKTAPRHLVAGQSSIPWHSSSFIPGTGLKTWPGAIRGWRVSVGRGPSTSRQVVSWLSAKQRFASSILASCSNFIALSSNPVGRWTLNPSI
jgi:hypothetical protein